MTYVPLRVHTVFSIGRGVVHAGEFADFLQKMKLPALAVTDPFTLAGWEKFHHQSGVYGLKFLPGMEVKLQNLGSLVLFPLSREGYFSIVHSFNQKIFSRMKDVAVIFVPGNSLARGPASRLSAIADVIRQVPKENLYLGLEWNSKRWLVDLARSRKIPLVWAQSLKWISHPRPYLVASAVFGHRPLPEMLENDSRLGAILNGPMDDRAILKRWGDIGREAMKNTFDVAARVEFDFGRVFPNLESGYPLLEEVVNAEMRRRKLTTAENERTFRELKIIKDMDFASYFLIAAEIGSFCRKNAIYFNLRGSAASSFVLYLLGLSRINPLDHNLLFERFVNSLREDLPDIDMDIDSSKRSRVLNWVFENYRNKVAFLSTHKFFRARSALYEVARSYGYNPEEAHKLSKALPMFASPGELRGKGKGKLAEIYEHAAMLDGVYRELSLHLGGVIFSDQEIKKSFPMERSPAGFAQVIWDKDTIERLKIFKLDLLGVRGFDVISPVASSGQDIDFRDLQTWENIRRARTIGCFQLESPLARENLRRATPGNIQELAISIAIIRPGPAKSGMKKSYLEKKPLFHPVFGEIFPQTRGTVIFEEQISLLLHTITGWNLEFSEKVRKDLKKKKGEAYCRLFYQRGKRNGWKETELREFWKLAGGFSLYAFNQAHSISYAYSAYLSAWFKTRDPVVFFCRLFNSGGGYYTLPFYVEEARRWGIRILPPDVNHSSIGFSRNNGSIRTGLIFVKGVGERLSGKILECRESGYESLENFVARTSVNERDLSALMAVAAFGSLGHDRLSPREQEKNWQTYLGFLPNP
jgi:DNA polymerase-3 subunit alpha